MKFKIIAAIVAVVFLIVLTVLFRPAGVQYNEDGTPVEVPTAEVQQ